MRRNLIYFLFISLVFTGCGTSDKKNYSVVKNIGSLPEDSNSFTKKTHRIDIACFIYHRFGDDRYPSTNTSVSLFKQQLQYLKDNRFKVITFGEAIDLILDDRKDIEKTAVITIDDAFKSFLKNALPLLKAYGYKATIFVNTETVGAGDYMGWDDLGNLLKEGIEIGNHTHSHAYFLSHKENKINFFREDINISKKLLHEKLGIDPQIFAYPYGEFDDELKNEISSSGFKAAAGQYAGVLCEFSDIFAIPRFPINDEFGSINRFIEKVNTKALRITNAGLSTNFKNNNPPNLEIIFNRDDYDLNRIQGFIQNGAPVLKLSVDSLVSVRLSSHGKLLSRRTTYTITVPSKSKNQWFWYSRLWINPDIKD